MNTVLCPQIGDLQCCCWRSGTLLRSHTAIQSDIPGWCRLPWLPPLSADALTLGRVRRRPGAAAVHTQHHPGRHLGPPLRGQPRDRVGAARHAALPQPGQPVSYSTLYSPDGSNAKVSEDYRPPLSVVPAVHPQSQRDASLSVCILLMQEALAGGQASHIA